MSATVAEFPTARRRLPPRVALLPGMKPRGPRPVPDPPPVTTRPEIHVPPPDVLPAFVTVKDCAEKLLGISEQSLRWWLHTDKEGFRSECCSKRGGRIFVSVQAVRDWLLRGDS